MQPESSGIKTWQWVITVVVIVALIIIGIFVFGNKKTETPAPGEETASTSAAQSANGIVMSDQFPGNVVYISSVQLNASEWVAIHGDNKGQPGDVIGYASVSSGTNPVKVTLTKSTVEGGVYYAVLHSDDGDGKFDVAKDLPLKDSDGNVIMRIFHATATANIGIKG
jgi:hypothetical protein